jgi:HEXXH motif-containing protein
MESIARAFASPYEIESATLPGLVAERLFERTRSELVECLERDALRELTERVAAIAVPQSEVWRPELGIVSSVVRHDAVLAAIQFLLAFAAGSFDISGTLKAPAKLFLDGVIIPISGAVTIVATEASLFVRSDTGNRRLERRARTWIDPDGACHRLPGSSVHGREFYVMAPFRHAQDAVFPDPFSTEMDSLAVEKKTHDAVATAIKAFDDEAVDYGPWVRDSLVGASLIPKDIYSAPTSPGYPGLVALPCDLDRLDYFEILVVAACHQRLCQLALVLNLGTVGKEDVHYVPARRSYITARRALAASHEHVNVMLAFRSIRASGDEVPELERRIERRRLMLATDCAPILDRSDVLSSAGAELWRRLKFCLDEQGEGRIRSARSWPEQLDNESVGPRIPVAGLATDYGDYR